MYTRKTKDIYVVFGNYGYGDEEVYASYDYKDAKARFKEYLENDRYGTFSLKKKREKIL